MPTLEATTRECDSCHHVVICDESGDAIADVYVIVTDTSGRNRSWCVFFWPSDGPPAFYPDEVFDGRCGGTFEPEAIALDAVRHRTEQRNSPDPWDDDPVDTDERDAIHREPASAWTRLRHPEV